MWKKSFIFLLVSAVALLSLSAYPAFFYGGAKAEETPAVKEVQETSTEEQEKSTQDLNYSKEETEEVDSAKSNDWEDTKSVIELLEEARVKKSVIDKVKDACFLIDEGRTEMIAAYNAEVERRVEAEKEAEKTHWLFLPLASYKPSVKEWGVGLAVGFETKGLAIQVQALKPVAGGGSFLKDWSDTTIVLGAGIRL